MKAPYLADFIRLALHTGCRRGELLGLRWEQVDLSANIIHLQAEETKSGRHRSVPLNAAAQEAIKSRLRFRSAHCPGSYWVIAGFDGQRIESVKTAFATACRKAGIKDFRIHDMRHTMPLGWYRVARRWRKSAIC